VSNFKGTVQYPLRTSDESEIKERLIRFIMYNLESSLGKEIDRDPKLIQYIKDKLFPLES